jgi:hypothetical protein
MFGRKNQVALFFVWFKNQNRMKPLSLVWLKSHTNVITSSSFGEVTILFNITRTIVEHWLSQLKWAKMAWALTSQPRMAHLISRSIVSCLVTPRVTLFPNYLHYKLNQASSVMVNQVIEVQNQNLKSGVRI